MSSIDKSIEAESSLVLSRENRGEIEPNGFLLGVVKMFKIGGNDCIILRIY